GTVVVASPAKACACGGVVAAEGESIEVGHEAAAVAWDGQVEDIVLQMDMTASTDDAAVIIPTPADPQVQPADPDFFADLREMAAPPRRELHLVAHIAKRGAGHRRGSSAGARPRGRRDGCRLPRCIRGGPGRPAGQGLRRR